MKIWTIYRFQAGDPRERWLRVGQLGTETEQNAIAAARAIWGDGSENHWYYGAEPFPLPGGDAEAETIAEGRFQSVERQLADIERRLTGCNSAIGSLEHRDEDEPNAGDIGGPLTGFDSEGHG
jgi:hypothetical protein